MPSLRQTHCLWCIWVENILWAYLHSNALLHLPGLDHSHVLMALWLRDNSRHYCFQWTIWLKAQRFLHPGIMHPVKIPDGWEFRGFCSLEQCILLGSQVGESSTSLWESKRRVIVKGDGKKKKSMRSFPKCILGHHFWGKGHMKIESRIWRLTLLILPGPCTTWKDFMKPTSPLWKLKIKRFLNKKPRNVTAKSMSQGKTGLPQFSWLKRDILKQLLETTTRDLDSKNQGL